MGHNSADYIHYVTEALKLAFADREAYIGDPRFVKNIPIDMLLSDAYAARRRAAIRKDRAIDGVPPPGLRASAAAATLCHGSRKRHRAARPGGVSRMD